MTAAKLLISLPNDLNSRFRALIPARQRSEIVRQLLETELEKREKQLYKAACAVEADLQVQEDMKDWDVTLNDGIESNEMRRIVLGEFGSRAD